MRLKAHISLLLAIAPALGAFAFTQESPDMPQPVRLPVPTDSQAPGTDLGIAIELLKSSVHGHYRNAPWAEELTLELAPEGAPPRRTIVRISCDPAASADADASPSRPAIRLELDTLTIVATPSRFTAISASAPNVAFETALSPSRPFIEQLRELVPALPFPQLHLALDPDSDQAWARAVAAIAPSAGSTLREARPGPEDASGVVFLTSINPQPPGEDGAVPALPQFQAKLLPDRGGLIELIARDTFGTAPGTLRITCKPLDPPAPSAFSLDLGDRQRVDSLARLRPPEPEIKPGMRLPALGLVDDALALWSPQAAFDAQRTPLNAPVRLALVFYDAADEGDDIHPSQADDAFDALLLVRGLSDKYRRDSVNSDRTPQPAEDEPLPRVGVVPVAVFDIAAFGPEVVREEAIAWAELETPGAFTSAGSALLKRFSPTGGVSIVVIDEGQIVRGVIPWDGRTSAQRRNDLDAALRGIAPRRTAPDQPADAAPATPPPAP